MTIAKSILRGKVVGLSGGFRGRIDLDTADPALPFPFETGSTAVEGALSVVAAAIVDATAAHGVAGTLAAVAVADTAITGAHGVSGVADLAAVAAASITGSHGVSGSLAAVAAAEFSGAGTVTILGTIDVQAVATVSMVGEFGAVEANVKRGGVKSPRRRYFPVPIHPRRDSFVAGSASIVATAQIAMVGETFAPARGRLDIVAGAMLAASGLALRPFPLRVIPPALREGALRVEACATLTVVGVFDRERMDEEDLLLRAWPLLDLAA